MFRKFFMLLPLVGLFAVGCKDKDCTVDAAARVREDLAAYNAGTLGSQLKKTASGLEYIIHEQGTGATVANGDLVPTHYYGALKADGDMFDNSYAGCGDPPLFTVGQLISGFNEGMKLLNRGGKATLFIPYQLGYGTSGSGSIPPKADLVFYIELQ